MTNWKSDDIPLIIEQIKAGECVPFLGAGASMGHSNNEGLPNGSQLANILAAEVQYPGPDAGDFLRVCQYYEYKSDARRLRQSIKRRLDLDDLAPGRVHQLIAKLPIEYILTTNFDNLMENAFRRAGKAPSVAVYDVRGKKAVELPSTDKRRPLVYKLHGSMEDENLMSMLCTEDDAIEFIARLISDDPKLPKEIKMLFNTYKSFLFIGYGLRDWNIRSMLRALRQDQDRDAVRSFAVQPRPAAASEEWSGTMKYYDKKENVKVIEATAEEFMDELDARFFCQ